LWGNCFGSQGRSNGKPKGKEESNGSMRGGLLKHGESEKNKPCEGSEGEN